MSDKVRQNEVKNEPAVVEWRGHTFTIPRDYSEWSVDLLESLEEGKSAGIVRGALGPNQWRTFKATNPHTPDLAELSDVIAKAMGFGSTGESPASSD